MRRDSGRPPEHWALLLPQRQGQVLLAHCPAQRGATTRSPLQLQNILKQETAGRAERREEGKGFKQSGQKQTGEEPWVMERHGTFFKWEREKGETANGLNNFSKQERNWKG